MILLDIYTAKISLQIAEEKALEYSQNFKRPAVVCQMKNNIV